MYPLAPMMATRLLLRTPDNVWRLWTAEMYLPETFISCVIDHAQNAHIKARMKAAGT